MYKLVKSRDKTLKYHEGFYHEIFNNPEKSQVLSDMGQRLMNHN